MAFLFEKRDSFQAFLKIPYVRDSSDPFRILMEYTIAILMVKIFGFESTGTLVFLALLGTIGFVISTYGMIMIYIFNRVPILHSDIAFLKVGLTIAYRIKFLIFLGAVLSGILVYNLFYFLSALLLALEVSNTAMLIGGILFLILGLFHIHKFNYHLFHHRTVYSFTIHLFRNYLHGIRYNFLLKKDQAFFDQYNLYKNVQLAQKPNIVIFSIESYGSIVMKKAQLRESMKEVFETYGQQLSDKGFLVRSSFSNAPQFGGGSWLSYTSFMFGMKFDDMNQYNLLFKNNSAFQYYQSLLSYLKTRGYKNYLLCPLGGGYNDKVDWNIVQKNFDADEFLDWNKMEYKGKRYQYLKLGYSPSDQYSLHKADQLIEEESVSPFSLFFSTLNSHMPFHSPEDVVENWEDLNSGLEDKEKIEDYNSNLLSKYQKAIRFQLSFILDYISKKNQDDTIYILFGDHQPPFITDRKMGFSTPVHVISKNASFLTDFEELGFASGFWPTHSESSIINHEGFYSLFMKAFNRTFGTNKMLELPYLAEGIQLR